MRAKTSATAATLQTDPQRRRELQETAREYLALAQLLLRPPPPSLIGVGGLSGSGKSTLAHNMAPLLGGAPGAVVIRSDVIRKRLCGVDPFQRLGPEGYTAETSRRVYDTVTERAGLVAERGHAAIADAVFGRPSDREALERVAQAAGVAFVGLWLEAPEAELTARSRRRERDPSDADAEVIRHQLAQDAGAITWHRVDASSPPEQVLRKATAILGEHLKDGTVRRESQPL